MFAGCGLMVVVCCLLIVVVCLLLVVVLCRRLLPACCCLQPVDCWFLFHVSVACHLQIVVVWCVLSVA